MRLKLLAAVALLPLAACGKHASAPVTSGVTDAMISFRTLVRLPGKNEEIPTQFFLPRNWNKHVAIWITDEGKASTLKYENLGGATSSGEFGSLLTAAFSPQSRAEFKELRKDIFNKRQTVVYDFKVKKAFSANQITDRTTHQSVIAGYQGTVWIDAETKRVLRIEQSSEGVPANFAITLSESAVEYDWVKIADQPYLLPVRAEVLLGSDRDRYYTRNVIEFKNYRKFDSDIKFLDSDK